MRKILFPYVVCHKCINYISGCRLSDEEYMCVIESYYIFEDDYYILSFGFSKSSIEEHML